MHACVSQFVGIIYLASRAGSPSASASGSYLWGLVLASDGNSDELVLQRVHNRSRGRRRHRQLQLRVRL
jgi:hypothetical protein